MSGSLTNFLSPAEPSEESPGDLRRENPWPKAAYADSHCHLADPRIHDRVQSFITRAKDKNIHFFLQGGVGPEDWELQKQLQKKYPEIGLCFGLHPYWTTNKSMDECDLALDQLGRQLPQALALGELGLDLRPKIVKNSFEEQMHCFIAQLEMAEMWGKPIVLHLVRAFEQVKKVFSHYKVPRAGGLVHSFNSGPEEADFFLSQGLHLSIGGPLCRPHNEKLIKAIEICPLNRLLLESDCPDQAPANYRGRESEPITIFEVADIIAEIKKKTASEVLDISRQNLETLLHGKSK